MVQFNFAEEVNSDNEPVIEPTDVMTGDKAPERCPVCGGPQRQYEVFEAE